MKTNLPPPQRTQPINRYPQKQIILNPVQATYLSSACLILLGLILSWTTGEVHSALIIVPLIVVAGVYSLSPQIMWWFWQRNPPDLPTDLAPLLQRFDLYRRLDLAGKREFRRRTFLLREATHVHGQAIEEIPADIHIMVAASAATIGFHRREFLLEGFNTVVFYRHYFPSPVHDVLHCSEMHSDDGAIIWTLNVFLRSCIEPKKYLHLGLYEYARALFYLDRGLAGRMESLALDYPQVERLTGFSETKLKEFIGLDPLDLPAITLVLFHTHREEMSALAPLTLKEIEAELAAIYV